MSTRPTHTTSVPLPLVLGLASALLGCFADPDAGSGGGSDGTTQDTTGTGDAVDGTSNGPDADGTATSTTGSTADGSESAGSSSEGGTTEPIAPPPDTVGYALPVEVVTNGAVVHGEAVVAVGTTETRGQLRDAFVAIVGEPEERGFLIGGTQNDQFYAVASDGVTVAATGLSRSFNGPGNADEAILVLGLTEDAPTFVRLSVPADEFLQGRALVADGGTGWIVGGQHLQNARAFFARVSSAGTVSEAVSLGNPAIVADFDPLRIVPSEGTLVVAFRNGVVAGLGATDLQPQWAARLVRNGTPALITDIGAREGDIVVTGEAGLLGFVAELEVSGTDPLLTASTAYLQSSPRGVASADLDWVVGVRGTTTFVARHSASGLEGVVLDGFDRSPSAFLPMHLVERMGTLVAVPRIVEGFALAAVNDVPVAACAGEEFGTKFIEATQPSELVLEALALDDVDLPLQAQLRTDFDVVPVPLGELGCP